jgi:hypothetical protein
LKQAIYTKVDDFLRDDDFIRYVVDACTENESYWTSYLKAAPQIRMAYEKACYILNHLDDDQLLSPEETERLKLRIRQSTLHTFN